MKNGIYVCNKEDFGRGNIKVKFKETKSSYILDLIENTAYFSPGHIETMFQNSNRCIIKKDRSQHAFLKDDYKGEWFTIYPFIAGIPFLFNYNDTI